MLHTNSQVYLEEESDEQIDDVEVSALRGRSHRGQRNYLVVVLVAFLQQMTKINSVSIFISLSVFHDFS